MISIDIPGRKKLQLAHLVLDYNGTLACDGAVLPGVEDLLRDMSERITIHVLTADTFGSVEQALYGYPVTISILPAERQDVHKQHYVQVLGAEQCVCIGNGSNDSLMLKSAALGIAVVQREGASSAALRTADIVAPDILAALDLLHNPDRVKATLRV